jgi:hypothetical protein
MATLRTTARNLLRLEGFHSIQEGIRTVMHNIKLLLAISLRQTSPEPNYYFRAS